MQDDLSTPEGPLLSRDEHTLEADVLVLGGGPAGTWAAWTAASAGARVVLADKGYCGTSGATAPSGTGVCAQRDRSFVLLPLATPSRSPATST
jgi:glycine/D-amino acid oxidase-like deaminating enzyme